MEKLEKERKFLVKLPKSWASLSDLFDNLIDVQRITQTYLIPLEGEPATRVRKTVQGLTGTTSTVYHFNQKKPVSPGVHKEKENIISKAQYEQYLTSANKDKVPIEKIRFVFRYYDHVFELDVFRGVLKGMAVLEIELEDMNDKFKVPPFLQIRKEVTEDRLFSNFNLANKDLHEEVIEILDV